MGVRAFENPLSLTCEHRSLEGGCRKIATHERDTGARPLLLCDDHANCPVDHRILAAEAEQRREQATAEG